MNKITRRNGKIALLFSITTIIAAIVLMFALDWTEENWSSQDRGYYTVMVNGEEVGGAKSKEEVDDAILAARLQLNEESGQIVYAAPEVEITYEKKIFANTLSEEELQSNIYNVLLASSDVMKIQAYMVNIEGYTITLDSKEAVIELLNVAKEKYDIANEFSVDLVEDTSGNYSAITLDVVHADTEENAVSSTVFASIFSSANDANEIEPAEENSEDGIVALSFQEDIEIVETYVDQDEVIGVDEAIDLVTKEKEENQVYEVVSGDCLSSIATQYGMSLTELLSMNQDYSESSVVNIGDILTVTVPEPEISVLVEEERTYEEYYDADVVYVENDDMYTNESNVISEGSQGYRRVVALITYKNGIECSREITDQTIINEAVAKVVEIGTKVPPTFVKPLSAGTFSSGFGYRWGVLHEGVDWYCSTGTVIFASCGGTVIQAGWNGGYGYSVLIQHENGIQTRYAHLSKISVSVGQTLSQYDKIGNSGSTGDSTGPHLHFEIIVNGIPVDPLTYLN